MVAVVVVGVVVGYCVWGVGEVVLWQTDGRTERRGRQAGLRSWAELLTWGRCLATARAKFPRVVSTMIRSCLLVDCGFVKKRQTKPPRKKERQHRPQNRANKTTTQASKKDRQHDPQIHAARPDPPP